MTEDRTDIPTNSLSQDEEGTKKINPVIVEEERKIAELRKDASILAKTKKTILMNLAVLRKKQKEYQH